MSDITNKAEAPSSGGVPTKVYKFHIAAKRNPKLTHEEFYHKWSNVYGPKAAEWMKKFGVIEYVQYRTPPEEKAFLEADPRGLTVMQWDGIAEVTVRDLGEFAGYAQDPYFIEVLHPEEKEIFDMSPSGMAVTIGFTEALIKDGKRVEKAS